MILVAMSLAGDSARDYARAAAAATVTERVYDGWYTALLVRGTRVDEALLGAQATRLEAITGQAVGAGGGTAFVLAVSGQFKDELRFAADGTTPWTVHVASGGTPCSGLTVTDAKKPTAQDLALYPHLTSWDKLLRVSPGDCPGGEPDTLLLTSARGRAELRWQAP